MAGGWLQFIGNLAGSGAEGIDRYQALQQRDFQNKLLMGEQQRRDQQTQLDAEHQQRLNALMDAAILRQNQQGLQDTYNPGQEINPDDVAKFQQYGIGSQVHHQVNPIYDLQTMHPQVSLPGFGPNEPGTAPAPITFDHPPMPEQTGQTESDVYTGTPQQQAADAQQKQFMQLIQGLNVNDPNSLARFSAIYGDKDLSKFLPAKPTAQPNILGTGPESFAIQQWMTAHPGQQPTLNDLAAIQRVFHPPSGGPGGAGDFTPDPEMIERAADAVLGHTASPSQIAELYGGGMKQGPAVKRAITDRVLQRDPKFDIQAAESNYMYGRNPATQTTVRYLDNIKNTIPIMQNIVDKLKLSNIQLVNAATIAGSKQFGNADVAAYGFMQTTLADEFAKVLQGGGLGNSTSDAKLRQANDALRGDMTPDQWKAVLDVAQEVLALRRRTLTSGTYMAGNDFGAAPGGAPPQAPSLAGHLTFDANGKVILIPATPAGPKKQ